MNDELKKKIETLLAAYDAVTDIEVLPAAVEKELCDAIEALREELSHA